MEAILALTDQYETIKAFQLKELVAKEIEQITRVKNEQDQHLNDDWERIRELTQQFDTLNKNLQQERQVLEVKQQDLTKHLASLKELQSEKNRYLEENRVLELKKNKLMASKPNIRDQKLLECGKKKIKFYKNLSRIRWDYAALKQNVKGYVSNNSDYINHFSYENDNKDTLADNLWKEIELSTTEGLSSNACNKENIANN